MQCAKCALSILKGERFEKEPILGTIWNRFYHPRCKELRDLEKAVTQARRVH